MTDGPGGSNEEPNACGVWPAAPSGIGCAMSSVYGRSTGSVEYCLSED
ncbi:MAG: hypothetical protein WAM97_22820 [Acidimicrobiales bacterium]